jgi:hypothetical protein
MLPVLLLSPPMKPPRKQTSLTRDDTRLAAWLAVAFVGIGALIGFGIEEITGIGSGVVWLIGAAVGAVMWLQTVLMHLATLAYNRRRR